jgi:hypothetical protein
LGAAAGPDILLLLLLLLTNVLHVLVIPGHHQVADTL